MHPPLARVEPLASRLAIRWCLGLIVSLSTVVPLAAVIAWRHPPPHFVSRNEAAMTFAIGLAAMTTMMWGITPFVEWFERRRGPRTIALTADELCIGARLVPWSSVHGVTLARRSDRLTLFILHGARWRVRQEIVRASLDVAADTLEGMLNDRLGRKRVRVVRYRSESPLVVGPWPMGITLAAVTAVTASVTPATLWHLSPRYDVMTVAYLLTAALYLSLARPKKLIWIHAGLAFYMLVGGWVLALFVHAAIDWPLTPVGGMVKHFASP